MSCGIYKIINLLNNKVYVGKSKDIENRFDMHKSQLNIDKHVNLHLQSAWRKDGKEAFEFVVLELCPENLLNEKEKYWIASLNSVDRHFGYNKTHGGDGGRLGREALAKMIVSLTGKKLSKETKLKLSIANKGANVGSHNGMFGKVPWNKGLTKYNNESLAQAGKKLSSHWQVATHPSKNKKRSAEVAKKISVASKGKPKSETHKKKISETLIGRKLSMETRQKMSITRKRKTP